MVDCKKVGLDMRLPDRGREQVARQLSTDLADVHTNSAFVSKDWDLKQLRSARKVKKKMDCLGLGREVDQNLSRKGA